MAQAEELGRGALLPPSVQNAYRERYRAIRPAWPSSRDPVTACPRPARNAARHGVDPVSGPGAAGDSFPLRYRANTVAAIRAQAQAAGLDVYDLRVVPDPTYLALNTFMFRASVMSERFMPKGWGVHLLGDLVRP